MERFGPAFFLLIPPLAWVQLKTLATLLRLNRKFAERSATVAEGAEIEVVKIPPRSSNLNPICERILGSVLREYLDHVVVLTE